MNKHHRVQFDTVLNWGLESPQNPQAGKPALREARTFLSAGSGDFPVARRSWPDFPTEKKSGDGRKEAGEGMLIEKQPSPEPKPIRATAAKEVGRENPAEKTTVRPNQNPKPILSPPRIKKLLRSKP